MKAVTLIPATINRFTSAALGDTRKRRAAGYARVSTDHEEQQTSYAAQVDYYTSYIKGREDWEFVSVYTDEGISATSTAKREGFNRMVQDALDGKLDLIVTKSVSRFARNTVDSLSTIRKLKEKGVEVYFEKENIWTFDGKGELLITIMSSLAQEESRSISENCTWGQRKRFSDGKVSVPSSRFLGYDKGEDGTLAVNKEQAAVVRLIYKLFLDGMTPNGIAARLTEMGYLSPGGKAVWDSGTVKSILTNEKYKGDALLQKTYTDDFLTKRQIANTGEVPQYYVANSHEAIIEPAIFDMVQREFTGRKGRRYSGKEAFSSRIKCGECGGWYGPKVWHSNTKYRRIVWQCNGKFKQGCKTPHLGGEEIKRLFMAAANTLFTDKDAVLAALAPEELFDTASLESERAALQDELDVTAGLIERHIAENARFAAGSAEYRERYEGLAARYEAAKARFEEATNELADKKARGEQAKLFLSELAARDGLLAEFDERLWRGLVECATVYAKVNVVFTFIDGRHIGPPHN
jgi:DNA invertase Pin-like site-specific DNA recombinase